MGKFRCHLTILYLKTGTEKEAGRRAEPVAKGDCGSPDHEGQLRAVGEGAPAGSHERGRPQGWRRRHSCAL